MPFTASPTPATSATAPAPLTKPTPEASITASIALARMGDKSLQPRLFVALGRLDFATLAKNLRLPYLRA